MKKTLVIFCFLLLVTDAFSQRRESKYVDSKRLDALREVWIELPESYGRNKKQKYPLIIVLDGYYLMDIVTGVMKYTNYFDDLPEAVIVGISQEKSNDREKDFGLEETNGLPDERGGQFFEFIGGDLLPFIKKNYAVLDFNVIIGHGDGAGFLNFFLFKDDPLFNGYISVSPEMTPMMEEHLAEKFKYLKKNSYYYLASSESDSNEILENCEYINDEVALMNNSNLHFKFDKYKEQTHYSLAPFGIASGLYHIFGVYQPITPKEYLEKVSQLKDNQTQYLMDKYAKIHEFVSKDLGPRYTDFKAIESAIIKNKNYLEFDNLANLAKKYYPKATLEKYYIGLKYEYQNLRDLAIKEYKNAYNRSDFGEITKAFLLEKIDELNRKI